MQCLYVYNKIDVLSIEEASALTVTALLNSVCSSRHRCWLGIAAADACTHATATQVDALARQPHSVPISCVAKLGMEILLEAMWGAMDLRRIYTKKARARRSFLAHVRLHCSGTDRRYSFAVLRRRGASPTSRSL